MRIGIYNEPSSTALGGTEVSVAILAESLATAHSVEIVHHREWLERDVLAKFSGANLGGVQLRYVPGSTAQSGASGAPWRRFSEAREWNQTLSAPYDAFVNFTHGLPPFCHARRGILVCLFPMITPLHLEPSGSRRPWQFARRLYAEFEWRRRMQTYEVVLGISDFTRTWIRTRWGVDSEGVYPPCDVHESPCKKAPLILSVGRFSPRGHVKCQLEMAGAFRDLAPSSWSYTLAGSVGTEPDDVEYLRSVQLAAKDSHASVSPNLDRNDLAGLFSRAAIFWHAAGFANAERVPEQYEHFGMTTVEAMSAGCVPLVFNGGGQPEIVQHGVNGFVWNSLAELKQHTARLIADEPLRQRMSEAARDRAQLFSRERYVAEMTRHIEDSRRLPLSNGRTRMAQTSTLSGEA